MENGNQQSFPANYGGSDRIANVLSILPDFVVGGDGMPILVRHCSPLSARKPEDSGCFDGEAPRTPTGQDKLALYWGCNYFSHPIFMDCFRVPLSPSGDFLLRLRCSVATLGNTKPECSLRLVDHPLASHPAWVATVFEHLG